MAERRGRGASREEAATIRIGHGIDIHPLAEGRRLMLGGMRIPSRQGLVGHSDADVLIHAVCDALLGAAGLPDLGRRFPDTDGKHRGRASIEFLKDVGGEIRRLGFSLINLDAVLLAEAPRLEPHLNGMRRRMAGALGCPLSSIGLKVKRAEGLGSIGRAEGMMAQVVALLGPADLGGSHRRLGGRRKRTAKRSRKDTGRGR